MAHSLCINSLFVNKNQYLTEVNLLTVDHDTYIFFHVHISLVWTDSKKDIDERALAANTTVGCNVGSKKR